MGSTRKYASPAALLALLLLVGLQQQQGLIAASSVQVQPAAVLAASALQQPLVDAPSSSHQQPKQQQQQSELAAAAAAVHDAGEGVLPGDPDPAADVMIEWLRRNGAEVNVAIRRNVPGSGRSTFAPRAFKRGDVLTRFPVEMAYALSEEDESLAVSATYLVADMAEEDSPWAPYFKSLPPPEGVWSATDVPKTYLPIIQDELMESAISHMQTNVDNLWEDYQDKYKAVIGPNVSTANITYAMGLLLSRLFRFDGTDVLLPIVDMANHHNNCTHSHLPEPCDPLEGQRQWEENEPGPKLSPTAGSGVFGPAAAAAAAANKNGSSAGSSGVDGVVSGQCIVWRAEEELQPGDEVCNSYKALLQDRSMLQYGFLQAGWPAEQLNALDRHERILDMDNVWTDPPGLEQFYAHGPRRFEGSPAQIRAEIDRLTAKLAMLKSADATIAAIKPDTNLDPEGRRLSVMLQWRNQRVAAIEAEIPRLQQQAMRLAKWDRVWRSDAAATDTQDARAFNTVNKELIQWLEEDGAKVDVELQLISPQQQVCISDDTTKHQSTCAAPTTAAGTGSPAAGVFTRRDVKQGETMAVIPVELGYTVKSGSQKLDSAVQLMTDLLEALQGISGSSSSSTPPASKAAAARPFMLSMPPLGSVRSLFNFPQEYLPLLHQPRAEHHIQRMQALLSKKFEEHRPSLEARDNTTTYAELQHAASVIATRPLLPLPQAVNDASNTDEAELLLVPIFSNARHDSSCAHHYRMDACPSTITTPSSSSSSSSSSSGGGGKKGLCFFWVAGTDLPSGAEVCVSYGHLRPDQAVLMYGLPLDVAAAAAAAGSSSSSSSEEEEWMSGLDTMEASLDEPFAPIAGEPLQHWMPATRDEAVAEALWLVQLHTNWTRPAVTANVTSMQPAASDPSGAFLEQLRSWRQQRIAAVEYELGRLSGLWNISSIEIDLQAQKQGMVNFGTDTLKAGGSRIDSNFTSSSSNPWQRLLDWMQHNGAVINVNVTYGGPQFGRVVTANEAVTRGDLLASIPLDLAWNTATSGGNGSMQLSAANFWAEMADPSSPYRPYLEALPSPDEMMCPLVMMPPEYRSLLANENAELFVEKYHDQVMSFWEEFSANMVSKVPSMTLDNFKYARGLLSTRLFGLHIGAAMVPLLDLANHVPHCPNFHSEQPCPQDPDRECIVWTAGSFHPQGAELCNGYKWMPNDRSMLQYGFLQSGPMSNELHTLDRPQVNASNMFNIFDMMKYGPEPFDGSQIELEAEITRLQSTLANLTATNAAASAAVPAASDKGGRLLSIILEWRQQRQAAIEREVARLQQRLAVVTGKEQQQEISAEDKLVEWIKENGGQVHNVRIGTADAAKRGVFTLAPIRTGDIMAVVPLQLSLAVSTNNLLIDAPVIHSEITAKLSPRAPFYTTLPAPEEVFSFYELPIKYAPVVQHQPTEEFINKSSAALADFVEEYPEQFDMRTMNTTDMKHIFSLVATRLFHFREGGHIVPFIDMANHHNGCNHSIALRPCDQLSEPSSSSSSSSSQGAVNTTQICAVWKAGADIAAGEEVCLSYGYLLPDRAMLQYGYIPQELLPAVQQQQQQHVQVPVPLFGIDRHDFEQFSEGKPLPWNFWLDDFGEPEPFTGTPAEIATEVTRLRTLLQELFAGDAAAATVQPVAEVDPTGTVLQQLRQLRELRKVAIAQEIARLNLQLQEQQEQERDEL